MAAPASIRLQLALSDPDVPPPVDSRMRQTADRVRELERQVEAQELTHHAETAQLQQERLGFAMQVDALTRQLTQVNQTLQQKEALVAQQERQIASLEQTRQEDQLQIEALRGQVEATRKEIALLTGQVGLLTAQLQKTVQGNGTRAADLAEQSRLQRWFNLYDEPVWPAVLAAQYLNDLVRFMFPKKEGGV